MIWFFVFLGFFSTQSHAQFKDPRRYWEWGVGLGTLNYQGDMTPRIDPVAILMSMRPQISANYKYSRSPYILGGIDLSYGLLHTKDEYYGNDSRGWEMYTDIIQFNGFVELNFLRFGKFYYKHKSTLYGKAGFGALYFNPEPVFNTPLPDNHFLYDGSYLSTNFFFGGGLKLRTSYRYIVCLEATLHYANNDFLEGYDKDPVSFNDVYGGFRITIQRLMMGKNYRSKYY